jgi:hypothetical protein
VVKEWGGLVVVTRVGDDWMGEEDSVAMRRGGWSEGSRGHSSHTVSQPSSVFVKSLHVKPKI